MTVLIHIPSLQAKRYVWESPPWRNLRSIEYLCDRRKAKVKVQCSHMQGPASLPKGCLVASQNACLTWTSSIVLVFASTSTDSVRMTIESSNNKAMMDSYSVSAGLVWATPVRPDQLGHHLEKYKKLLPVIQTLRLCHRFGKGPDVHITELPTEVEQKIEDTIFQYALKEPQVNQYYDEDSWYTDFEHFEGRCSPSDHLAFMFFDDRYLDVMDERVEVACETCAEELEHMFEFSSECTSGCTDKWERAAGDIMSEMSEHGCDWELDLCQSSSKAWQKRIDQKPGGAFTQYDEVG